MEILKILLIVLVVLLLFLLYSRVNVKEIFIDKCLGKRDGVSGCRDCCRSFKNMYSKCVSRCMRF